MKKQSSKAKPPQIWKALEPHLKPLWLLQRRTESSWHQHIAPVTCSLWRLGMQPCRESGKVEWVLQGFPLPAPFWVTGELGVLPFISDSTLTISGLSGNESPLRTGGQAEVLTAVFWSNNELLTRNDPCPVEVPVSRDICKPHSNSF